MTSRERCVAMPPAMPGWLRAVLVVVSTAILCSCRGPQTASTDPFQARRSQAAAGATEHASGPADRRIAQAAHLDDQPPRGAQAPQRDPQIVMAAAAMESTQATAPGASDEPAAEFSQTAQEVHHSPVPGHAHPFGTSGNMIGPGPQDVCWWQSGTAPEYKLPPADEILCDGGDDGMPVAMLRDGTLAGLDLEDAVAHYRTLEGKTVVVPTNEVCLYAPRFGAVRQVLGASANIRNRGPEGVVTDLALVGTESRFEPSTTLQRQEPAEGAADRPTSLLRGRKQGGGLENEQGISRASGNKGPRTNLQSIRFVLLDNRDQPVILGGMVNAIHWTHDLGVQVTIDRRKAQVINSSKQVAFLYHVEEQNKPRLKVVKLADRTAAHPGETVHFQLRYENVGNRPITELTLVDNLTTRLEYVDGSQQSDRPAEFNSKLNAGGSLALRWALKEPLEPGEGGVIEFDTRVR